MNFLKKSKMSAPMVLELLHCVQLCSLCTIGCI